MACNSFWESQGAGRLPAGLSADESENNDVFMYVFHGLGIRVVPGGLDPAQPLADYPPKMFSVIRPDTGTF